MRPEEESVDTDRFSRALALAGLAKEKAGDGIYQGIGTLAEKSVHRVLKFYMEENESFHEQRLGDYIADIYNGEGIIEVQSRNFGALKRKVRAFRELASITLVCPLEKNRDIIWVDPDTGEIKERRRSNRHKSLYHIMDELIFIRQELKIPGIRILGLLLQVEDYRLLDGYGADQKKRATKLDRVPVRLMGKMEFKQNQDYRVLVPKGLPEEFLSKDYAAAAGVNARTAGRALAVLTDLGIVERVGQRGRANLYRETKDGND